MAGMAEDPIPWRAPEVDIPDEPFVADERTMLDGWLERVRARFFGICSGLSGTQLALRSSPTPISKPRSCTRGTDPCSCDGSIST